MRSSGVLGAPPIATIVGGLGDTFSSLFNNSFPRWTAQLAISYPLGLSAQKANVSRARVQLNQVQAQLKQIELQVATDVTNAAINVQSGVERVQAAQAAREFAQKTLEAEQSKFEVGMSTNYNVILTQRDLATAQSNELQAILNYRKSLVELERVQQTTLHEPEYHGAQRRRRSDHDPPRASSRRSRNDLTMKRALIGLSDRPRHRGRRRRVLHPARRTGGAGQHLADRARRHRRHGGRVRARSRRSPRCRSAARYRATFPIWAPTSTRSSRRAR